MKDLDSNIELGKEVFSNVPEELIPDWAGLILSCFNNHITNIPTPVKELFEIIQNPERWKQSHDQFTQIRKFLLSNSSYQPESYLLLAEIVAKVTYNTSGEPAPFDADSGWYIPSLAIKTAHYFDDERLVEEVVSMVLLFHRIRNFKPNLQAAKDLLLYRKIDNILWFDWDPIGINDMAPRDEYQSYVPGAYQLKKDNSNREQIANYLSKIEIERMGIHRAYESCLLIADRIMDI